jgi:predicted ribosome quality control (RQC) complex YloA/Tae2 family protein
MVLFFTCLSDPNIVIYMGKDKYENEELIKYAWPDLDVWFHVAELSSAHVYLRVPEGVTSLKEIPDELVQECAQLTKANSIEGCKKDRVGINYTWARNLKKTAGMETGAVSFYKPHEVMFIKIEKDPAIINKISKTKKELFPDLKKCLEEH